MGAHGLLIPLADNGASIWRESVTRTLGRLSVLGIATRGDSVVGFAHGAVALLPAYLGGARIGQVNHVFVSPALRSGGIGRRLLDVLETWFHARGVSSLELQVLSRNEGAVRFWEREGFERELLQMRRGLRPAHADARV